MLAASARPVEQDMQRVDEHRDLAAGESGAEGEGGGK